MPPATTKETKKPEVKYTEEELKVRSDLIHAMIIARDNREAPHAEFDDMTYSQYYDSNKRADLSYIAPKRNKQDKRIVTGYTREKDTTLLSTLLSYDFQADITVYNEDEMIYAELGNHMEDMVKKSREVESWSDIRPLVYREMIAQGDVFVEELWECMYIPDMENKNGWMPGQPIKDASFSNKPKSRKIERAAVKLHSSKSVYLGNFWEESDSKQGLIFTYEVIPRDLAESLYGTWDRWSSVPDSVDNTIVWDNMSSTYSDWNLMKIKEDMVGVLKVQQKFKNRYMIMLNGVMMLPTNFPLSEISPDGEHTIKHGRLEAINGCAYGKGQPAKTKVDQAVHDEFLRLMILGFEQGRVPPVGYRGKRVLPADIFNPGKINNNMKEGDVFPLLPQGTAINTAEFSMFQLIKEMISDKTINATFSGEQPQGQVTAYQIQQEKQQQLLKLGVNFDAVKNLEKNLVWARCGNLIMHYAKPTDTKLPNNPDQKTLDDVYRTFSIETTLQDGRAGIKVFEFTDKPFPSIRDHQQEEKVLSDHYGKPTQKVYFDGPSFMELLKYRWVVNIIPTQQDSDLLERQEFVENVTQAKNLFPGQVNDEYVKERFAIHIKEDPKQFFLTKEQVDQAAQANAQAGITPDATNTAGRGGGSPVTLPKPAVASV